MSMNLGKIEIVEDTEAACIVVTKAKEGSKAISIMRLFGMLELHWIYTKNILYCLLVGVGGIQLFSLYRKLNDASYFYYGQFSKSPFGDEAIRGVPRFEEYLAQSKWDMIFLIGIIGVVLLLISGALQQKSVSKVIYTLERLPVSSVTWYASMVLHHVLVLCIYLGVQMLCVFLGYWMYCMSFPSDAIMTQSLFLAFVRWDFLRSAYPITNVLRLVQNLIVVIYFGMLCAHQMICIHYKIPSVGVWLVAILMGLYMNINRSIAVSVGTIIVCIVSSIWMIDIFRQRKDRKQNTRKEENKILVETVENRDK